MFSTAIAGSLPKPEWLAETNKLWPKWQAEGDALMRAKSRCNTFVDQSARRRRTRCDWWTVNNRVSIFVHGFLEQVDGIDFENKVTMGIRNNRYDAQVPQVIAPLRLKGRVHAFEAQLARATPRKNSNSHCLVR
jgi:5-methyltetrahydropteroyltriglutamate--homocysteine methyltransferase